MLDPQLFAFVFVILRLRLLDCPAATSVGGPPPGPLADCDEGLSRFKQHQHRNSPRYRRPPQTFESRIQRIFYDTESTVSAILGMLQVSIPSLISPEPASVDPHGHEVIHAPFDICCNVRSQQLIGGSRTWSHSILSHISSSDSWLAFGLYEFAFCAEPRQTWDRPRSQHLPNSKQTPKQTGCFNTCQLNLAFVHDVLVIVPSIIKL